MPANYMFFISCSHTEVVITPPNPNDPIDPGEPDPCPDGYALINGECVKVTDPAPNPCPDGYIWADGLCIKLPDSGDPDDPPPIDTKCPDGYKEVDGVCIEDEDSLPPGGDFIDVDISDYVEVMSLSVIDDGLFYVAHESNSASALVTYDTVDKGTDTHTGNVTNNLFWVSKDEGIVSVSLLNKTGKPINVLNITGEIHEDTVLNDLNAVTNQLSISQSGSKGRVFAPQDWEFGGHIPPNMFLRKIDWQGVTPTYTATTESMLPEEFYLETIYPNGLQEVPYIKGWSDFCDIALIFGGEALQYAMGKKATIIGVDSAVTLPAVPYISNLRTFNWDILIPL